MNIEITPKYNIKDTVWFLADDLIIRGVVVQIQAAVCIVESNETFTSFKYRILSSSSFLYDEIPQSKLFDTKKELIERISRE